MVLYAHFTDQKRADQNFLAATILTHKTILHELMVFLEYAIYVSYEQMIT